VLAGTKLCSNPPLVGVLVVLCDDRTELRVFGEDDGEILVGATSHDPVLARQRPLLILPGEPDVPEIRKVKGCCDGQIFIEREKGPENRVELRVARGHLTELPGALAGDGELRPVGRAEGESGADLPQQTGVPRPGRVDAVALEVDLRHIGDALVEGVDEADVAGELDGRRHVIDADAESDVVAQLIGHADAEVEDHEVGLLRNVAAEEIVLPLGAETPGVHQRKAHLEAVIDRNAEVEMHRVKDLFDLLGGVAVSGIRRRAMEGLLGSDQGRAEHEFDAVVGLEGHAGRVPEQRRRIVRHRRHGAGHSAGATADFEESEARTPAEAWRHHDHRCYQKNASAILGDHIEPPSAAALFDVSIAAPCYGGVPEASTSAIESV